MTVSIVTSQQIVNKAHKINLDIPDRAAPSIEAKDLVGKIDDLLGSKVVNLTASVSGTCRDVLGAELLVQTTLQRGYLLRRVFIDVVLLLFVRIGELVVLPLVTRSVFIVSNTTQPS